MPVGGSAAGFVGGGQGTPDAPDGYLVEVEVVGFPLLQRLDEQVVAGNVGEQSVDAFYGGFLIG